MAAAVGATLTSGKDDQAAERQTAAQRAVLADYDISRLASDLAALYTTLLAAKS